MVMDASHAFLEQAQIHNPPAAADLSELAELHDRKLWHQLTLKLNNSIKSSAFQQEGFLIQLYRYLYLAWNALACVRAVLDNEPLEYGVTHLQEVHRRLRPAPQPAESGKDRCDGLAAVQLAGRVCSILAGGGNNAHELSCGMQTSASARYMVESVIQADPTVLQLDSMPSV